MWFETSYMFAIFLLRFEMVRIELRIVGSQPATVSGCFFGSLYELMGRSEVYKRWMVGLVVSSSSINLNNQPCISFLVLHFLFSSFSFYFLVPFLVSRSYLSLSLSIVQKNICHTPFTLCLLADYDSFIAVSSASTGNHDNLLKSFTVSTRALTRSFQVKISKHQTSCLSPPTEPLL